VHQSNVSSILLSQPANITVTLLNGMIIHFKFNRQLPHMNETLYTRNRPSKLQIFSFDFCAIMHVNTIFMKAGIMNVPRSQN
jgi:hypothetical protein